jgi:prepilin-type N-terminal cleavage/methylation domain-containing protein
MQSPPPDKFARNSALSAGFTLVELSIVLVIIGLIVGGLLAGQTLVLSAQARKEITQLRTFTVAIGTFKGKYNALPGDMANATTYWGTDPNCNGGSYVSSPPVGTCNGNGDGFISADIYFGGYTLETFFAWQQLSLAKLVPANYYPVPSLWNSGYSHITLNDIGVSVPASTLVSGVGYDFMTITPQFGYPPEVLVGNTYFVIGSVSPSGSADVLFLPGLTAPMTAAIDAKIDDGLPLTGNFTAMQPWRAYGGSAVNPNTNCFPGTSANYWNPPINSTYNQYLTSAASGCIVFYKIDS